MQILVLDILIKQTQNTQQISKDALERIFREYERFAELEEEGSSAINAYLMSHNGKKMAGSQVSNIFKYRLDGGDRILYTYGKYLSYIREEDKDSLILLGYAKHDDQGFFAKNTDFRGNHYYEKNKEILSKINELKVVGTEEFTVEELIEIAGIISKDFIKGHSLSVVPDENLGDIDIEDFDKYLSEEQNQCLNDFADKPCPTLVMGGAGTGKTLVAIHMLNNFQLSNPGGKAAYFTQSNELLDRAKHLYEVVSSAGDKDTTEFHNINSFCMKMLGRKYSDFVETKQFKEFIELEKTLLKLCKKHALDTVDVWTEIRGVIKGTMESPIGKSIGFQWSRFGYLKQDDYSQTAQLERKNYIERSEENPKEFCLCESPEATRQRIAADMSLTDEQREQITAITTYYQEFDSQKIGLSSKEYLALKEESSSIEVEKRDSIWQMFSSYETWLKSKGYFDDNDLARETLNIINDIQKYDLIVVDEVQDYTELQIYLLFNLSDNGVKIAFAGDEHQNINPTLFREKRVQSLFKENSSSLKTVFLRKNFRCQQNVVEIANSIAELRRTLIGARSKESEQPGEAERTSSKPYRLECSSDNIVGITKEIMNHPGTAILVPDFDTREALIDIIGRSNYRNRDVDFIFTVPEIKGMEYEYVVCFDLVGRHSDVWNEIFRTGDSKHNTKYRFYFNLLYVAITRSQNHLCFIDRKINSEIESALRLDSIDVFDSSQLYFESLSNSIEDWIKWAHKYEQEGQYEQAIQYYEKGNGNAYDIYRCEMKLAEKDREFDVAAQYAVLIGDYQKAQAYAAEIQELENINLITKLLAGNEKIDMARITEAYSSINGLVEDSFAGYEDDEIDAIREQTANAVKESIIQDLATIN
ncbi:MAG: AAA family ATPase [Bacillota bacterium]|nr:AAA family ATPase [Bacillota bacterium]